MGRMEAESRKRARRNQIREVILTSVKIAGVLALAVTVPNAIAGLDKLGLLPKIRQKELVGRSYQRLIKAGLLRSDGKYVRLTQKGQTELHNMEARNHRTKKPRRWDGKWRILIFDIPNYRKGLRDKMRATLRAIGFHRLQDSVWIYPYDCEDLIVLLKADFRIGRDVLYMIVDSLEGDGRLRKEFELR